MNSLIIRPGTEKDVDTIQALANDAKSLPFLGGWSMRESISSVMKKNEKCPLNVVAELDGEVVGFSDSKDRNCKYTEYELIAVNPDYRRQRIATAMYTYHTIRGALTGKYFLRDFTNHFNEVMNTGYLPSLGFNQIACLRNRGRNFSSANWWIINITNGTLLNFFQRANSGPHGRVEFWDLDIFGDVFKSQYTESQRNESRDEVLQQMEAHRQFAIELLSDWTENDASLQG